MASSSQQSVGRKCGGICPQGVADRGGNHRVGHLARQQAQGGLYTDCRQVLVFHTSVIVLSGEVTNEKAGILPMEGVSSIMSKPVNQDKLLAAVKKAFGTK